MFHIPSISIRPLKGAAAARNMKVKFNNEIAQGLFALKSIANHTCVFRDYCVFDGIKELNVYYPEVLEVVAPYGFRVVLV